MSDVKKRKGIKETSFSRETEQDVTVSHVAKAIAQPGPAVTDRLMESALVVDYADDGKSSYKRSSVPNE